MLAMYSSAGVIIIFINNKFIGVQQTVQTKRALMALILKNRDRIESYGVKELGLFGSFVNDTRISQTSDVDFLIEFENGKKSFDNFMDLSFFLENILGIKVELVTTQSLSKYIGPHILRQIENVGI